MEKLPGGKSPLWFKTFPDIAVKALSSSHKQIITFYEVSTQVAGHHDVEDMLGEAEHSRVKALANCEAD